MHGLSILAFSGPTRVIAIVLVALLLGKFLKLAFSHREYHQARLGFFGWVLVAALAIWGFNAVENACRSRSYEYLRPGGRCGGAESLKESPQVAAQNDQNLALAESLQAEMNAAVTKLRHQRADLQTTTNEIEDLRHKQRLLQSSKSEAERLGAPFIAVRIQRREKRAEQLQEWILQSELKVNELEDRLDRLDSERSLQYLRPEGLKAPPAVHGADHDKVIESEPFDVSKAPTWQIAEQLRKNEQSRNDDGDK